MILQRLTLILFSLFVITESAPSFAQGSVFDFEPDFQLHLDENNRDPFRVLGIKRGDSSSLADRARTAWRKLSKKYHPDLNPNDPMAGAIQRAINGARDKIESGSFSSAYTNTETKSRAGDPYKKAAMKIIIDSIMNNADNTYSRFQLEAMSLENLGNVMDLLAEKKNQRKADAKARADAAAAETRAQERRRLDSIELIARKLQGEIINLVEEIREQKRFYRQELWEGAGAFERKKNSIAADTIAIVAEEFAARFVTENLPQGVAAEEYKIALLRAFERSTAYGFFNPYRIGFRMDHGALLESYAAYQKVIHWGGIDLGKDSYEFSQIEKFYTALISSKMAVTVSPYRYGQLAGLKLLGTNTDVQATEVEIDQYMDGIEKIFSATVIYPNRRLRLLQGLASGLLSEIKGVPIDYNKSMSLLGVLFEKSNRSLNPWEKSVFFASIASAVESLEKPEGFEPIRRTVEEQRRVYSKIAPRGTQACQNLVYGLFQQSPIAIF